MTGRSIVESYSRKPRLKYTLSGKDGVVSLDNLLLYKVLNLYLQKVLDIPSTSSSFSIKQLFASVFLPQGWVFGNYSLYFLLFSYYLALE